MMLKVVTKLMMVEDDRCDCDEADNEDEVKRTVCWIFRWTLQLLYMYITFFHARGGGFKTFEMLFLVLLVVNFLLPRN